MGFGLAESDLAVYRLVRGGESGVNLKLSDLFDQEVECPSLFDILLTLFTKKTLRIKLKAYPVTLINKLVRVQRFVDKKIEEEIRKANKRVS